MIRQAISYLLCASFNQALPLMDWLETMLLPLFVAVVSARIQVTGCATGERIVVVEFGCKMNYCYCVRD